MTLNADAYVTCVGMTRTNARRYLNLIAAMEEAALTKSECEYGHDECAHVDGGACSAEAFQIAEYGSRL